MVGIYKIVSPTNKVYIGQSWNIENRKSGYDNNGNLISTWNTIKEASIELKISSSGIVRCCKGLRKTTSKYQFKYI